MWTLYEADTRPTDYTNLESVTINGVDTPITSDMRKAQNSRVDRWDAHNSKIHKMEAVCLEVINSCLHSELEGTLKSINDPVTLWKRLTDTYGPASTVNRDIPNRFIQFLTKRMNDEETFLAHYLKLGKDIEAIGLDPVFLQAKLQITSPVIIHPLPERLKQHVEHTIRHDLDVTATLQYLINQDTEYHNSSTQEKKRKNVYAVSTKDQKSNKKSGSEGTVLCSSIGEVPKESQSVRLMCDACTNDRLHTAKVCRVASLCCLKHKTFKHNFYECNDRKSPSPSKDKKAEKKKPKYEVSGRDKSKKIKFKTNKKNKNRKPKSVKQVREHDDEESTSGSSADEWSSTYEDDSDDEKVSKKSRRN